jgi:hypothetical protein
MHVLYWSCHLRGRRHGRRRRRHPGRRCTTLIVQYNADMHDIWWDNNFRESEEAIDDSTSQFLMRCAGAVVRN